MRHGASNANRHGLIISDPEEGIRRWGLADGAGREIREKLRYSGLGPDTLIYTSPFRRTRETAEIVAEGLGASEPVAHQALRERFFGRWDGLSHENYQKVWNHDRENPGNTFDGVESAAEVLSRILTFLKEIDPMKNTRTILLVSHGDPMDILLSASQGMPLSRHMDVALATAEIRALLPEDASS